MLEEMGSFFDARLEGYERHQLDTIEAAREFYPFTARCLPQGAGVRILDLGCGTGLELEEYFRLCPSARVTGVDLAPGMLRALREKFSKQALELICGSYFDVPFGENTFDAAVSVESLHHFTQAEKIPLYCRLRAALLPGGCFVLTDYFARSDEEERGLREQLLRLRHEQRTEDGKFYHFDTPLTVRHEAEALRAAGFSAVEVLDSWGQTSALRAVK